MKAPAEFILSAFKQLMKTSLKDNIQ